MQKLKLYNWYGESFDAKTENPKDSIKLLKRQISNLFDRNKRDIKTYQKMNKNLFVQAKSKLTDEQKRVLKSLKVEYKNKHKVQKDLIKELKIADSLEALIKFELKKIFHDKKELKKYTLDYIEFMKNSGDDHDAKIQNINNVIKESRQQEKVKIAHEIYLNLILKMKAKNLPISENSISSIILEPIEDKFLKGRFFSFTKLEQLYKKLLSVQKELLQTKESTIQTFKKEFPKYKKAYEENTKKIKKDFKNRIVEAESTYTQVIFKMQNDNVQKAKQDKLKLKEKIATIKKIGDANLESKLYSLKYKQEVEKIKHKNNLLYLKKTFTLEKTLEDVTKLANIKISFDLSNLKNLINVAKDHLHNFYSQKSEIEIKKLTKEKVVKNNYDFKSSLKKANLEINAFYKAVDHNKGLSHFSKMFKKNSFNILKMDQYKIHKNKAKITYFQNLATIQKKYTYEAQLNQEKSLALIEYNKDLKQQLNKFSDEKLQSYKFLYSNQNSNNSQVQKANFLTEKQAAKKERDAEILAAKNSLKRKEFSKHAYKNVVKKLKINYKEKVNELKFANDVLKHKNVIKTSTSRYLSKKKMIKKIYEGKILEATKQTPVEISKQVTWLAALLNLFLPGLAELLFFKQKRKGIILMTMSLIMYLIFLPFSLGLTYSKIGGAFGLIDLGKSIHNFDMGITPDARYWLFGGVFSVFLLTAMLAFQISSLVSAYRVAKLMKEGTRPSNWTHTKRWLNTSGFPWLISVPGWFLIIFIVITPIVTSVLISFTNMGFNHEPPGRTVDWIGLDQYGKWWTFRNVGMTKSLFRVLSWTIMWTLSAAFLVIVVGTLFAVALNNPRIKFKKLFRLIYIIPWAIPAFITIIFLKSIFQADSQSLVNLILLQIGIIKEPINWFSSVWKIRVLLIVIQVWLGHSYIFLLVTGHLQSIPKDIYEAGSIDGANKRQLFRFLTIPSLLAAIAPLLITQFTFMFNNFTIISLFSGGGPRYTDSTAFLEGGTDILISWIYKLTYSVAQIDGNVGFAAAMTIVAALISISVAAYGFAKTISKGSR